MVGSNTFGDTEIYAGNAQCAVVPSGTDRCNGVCVGYSLPAKWWNGMWCDATNKLHSAYSMVDSIYTELASLITSSGQELGTEHQLTNIFYGPSVHFGEKSEASGSCSVAIGCNAIASGVNSTAIGHCLCSCGDNSIAIGINVGAYDTYDIAIGHNAYTRGYYSVAIGDNSSTSGPFSVALGTYNCAGYTSKEVITSGIAIGTYNSTHNGIAMGRYNEIYGVGDSTVLGNLNCICTGACSVIIGRSNVVCPFDQCDIIHTIVVGHDLTVSHDMEIIVQAVSNNTFLTKSGFISYTYRANSYAQKCVFTELAKYLNAECTPVLGYYGCQPINTIQILNCFMSFICVGCDTETYYGNINGRCTSGLNQNFSLLFVPNN